MYFKPAVSLAILAVCSASLLASGSNKILVTSGGSQAIVANTQGQQAIIRTNPFSALLGPQTIQILVAGPGVPPQAVQIPDKQVGSGGKKQSNVLRKVLATFSGVHDEISYQQLLNVIAEEVQVGKINPAVLQALQSVSEVAQSSQTGNPVIDQVANSQKAAVATQILYGQQTPLAGAPLQRLGGARNILEAQALGGISGGLQGASGISALIPEFATQNLGGVSGIAGSPSIGDISENIQDLYSTLTPELAAGQYQELDELNNQNAQLAGSIWNARQNNRIQAQLEARIPLGPQDIAA